MPTWRVREIAESKGITAYRLSKDSGITYAAIWNIWNDKTSRADLETLYKIARVLQVQPGELLSPIDLETLEDLEDVRAYDAAKAASDEFVPFEQALAEIAAERVQRKAG